MATDKLAIYNLTLTRLGQDRLESGQTNDNSRKLDAIYPQQLEELTSQGPEKGWKFATIITAADVSSVTITAFVDYRGTVTGGAELRDWIREGDFILTNLEDTCVDMRYVISIIDTTKFPPYFTKVLYLSCARELAYSIIQSATFQERLINEIEVVELPRAISRDEQEQYVKESSSSWVDAGRTGVIE